MRIHRDAHADHRDRHARISGPWWTLVYDSGLATIGKAGPFWWVWAATSGVWWRAKLDRLGPKAFRAKILQL